MIENEKKQSVIGEVSCFRVSEIISKIDEILLTDNSNIDMFQRNRRSKSKQEVIIIIAIHI